MKQDRFCPAFFGCVKKDLRVARALHRLYQEKLENIATYLYAGIVTRDDEIEISILFEELAQASVEHFQLLGRLILALGSDPILQLHLSLKGVGIKALEAAEVRALQALLYALLQAERQFYEHCRELLLCIDDGVVCSVLCCLQEETIEQIQKLSGVIGG